MKPAEFFKGVAKKGPAPAYIFHGPEIYLKTKAIDEIIKVIPDGQKDFNLHRFHGGETPLDEALSAARTLPFMAQRRVVIFRNIEKARLSKVDAGMLGDYLKDPNPQTTFVVTTDDPSASRTWAKKHPGLWVEVDFRPLRGGALKGAVREAAKERGVSIGGEAVDRLLEETGADLGRIGQEVEKLATAVGTGGEIGIEEVHLLVCGYAYQTMFDLVQAIADRNLAGSLKLVDRLFETGGETAGLVGMLARRFRVLRYLADEASPKTGGVPSALRVLPWQLTDLRRQAKGFSRDQLDGALGGLLEIDRLVKSAPVSSRLLLERFIIEITGPARSASSS